MKEGERRKEGEGKCRKVKEGRKEGRYWKEGEGRKD
jgi:hypothetical protein